MFVDCGDQLMMLDTINATKEHNDVATSMKTNFEYFLTEFV